MKKIALASLLICFLVNGCKKGNDISSPSSDAVKPVAATEAQPTAFFRITNLVPSGMILEANINDFDNQSKNADTYFWDFGNGITSTKKNPDNISFVPCGGTYTISLTVKNNGGASATYAQTYTVLCRGKNAHNTPVVHLPTLQIPAYITLNE